MCPDCGIAIDDHLSEGRCPSSPPAMLPPPETTTLWARSGDLLVRVDMHSATSGLYAAKRVAEELHLDPDYCEYWLVLVLDGSVVPQDEPIFPFSGLVVHLEMK